MNRRSTRALAIGVVLTVFVGASLYTLGLHPAHPVTTLIAGTRTAGRPKRLVVFVKGGGAKLDSYRPLLDRLAKEPELAGSDFLLYDHNIRRLTMGHAYDFATRLRAEIDARWIRAGGYDDIILAGHSLGSLVMREAYLQSAGRDPRQPSTLPWAAHVSRIVLLAGIGRGVDAEIRGRWALPLRLGRYIPFVRSSIMYDVLRGADFVTDVRVAWIRHFTQMTRAAELDSTAPKPPIIVQLTGTEDAVLQRDDNIDLALFPTAYHIDVPGAGHQTLHMLSLTPDPELAYRLFREAFVAPTPIHARVGQARPDSITRVVFLLHGLRSSREGWVRELAPLVRARMPNAEVVESSYGRLSILGFALPSTRRRELRWLEDQYTEYLARHPTATFDVVAHSNGAYLVGEGLTRVPTMRFDHVLLLGSVLPTDYPWRERHDGGQVGTLRSDLAAGDAVAGVLCSALRGIGMTDVGPSGWRGFDEAGTFQTEVAWYPGGHSAALGAANLASLAEFVVTGRVIRGGSLAPRPETALRWLSALAPWFARGLLLALAILAVRWVRRSGSLNAARVGTVLVVASIVAALLDVL